MKSEIQANDPSTHLRSSEIETLALQSGQMSNSVTEAVKHNGVGDIPPSTRGGPLIIGISGLCLWFLIFGLGVLVDSTSFRLVNDVVFRQETIANETKRLKDAPGGVANSPLLQEANDLNRQGPSFGRAVCSFFMGMFTYTPTNLGLLCFFGGLMGGCSSRAAYRRLRSLGKIVAKSDELAPSNSGQDSSAQPILSKTRIFYLSEHPFVSGLRSFVVYLALLSGFYLAAGDPFKDMSAGQYLRLAGLVSCVAFAVGYDPSRFTDLINNLPKPGGAKT